jgi:hypothetical protein
MLNGFLARLEERPNKSVMTWSFDGRQGEDRMLDLILREFCLELGEVMRLIA